MGGKRRKKSEKKSAAQPQPSILVRHPELRGWGYLLLSILFFASLAGFSASGEGGHLLGLLGVMVGWVLLALLGLSGYLLALYIGWIGWRKLFESEQLKFGKKHLQMAMILLSSCVLLTVIEERAPAFTAQVQNGLFPSLKEKRERPHLGGGAAHYLYKDLPTLNLQRMINDAGVFFLAFLLFALNTLLLFEVDLAMLYQALMARLVAIRSRKMIEVPAQGSSISPSKTAAESRERFVRLRIPSWVTGAKADRDGSGKEHDMLAIKPETTFQVRPSLSSKEKREGKKDNKEPFEGSEVTPIAETTALHAAQPQAKIPPPMTSPTVAKEHRLTPRQAAMNAQSIHNGDYTAFSLPSLELLTSPKKIDQSSLKKDLKRQAEVLEETLTSFGIEAKVGQINCGPTITSFEVHPSVGVKVQKIKALENDIALNMEAKSIRIIAPIPGKAAVGVEVPNPKPQEVSFIEILAAYQARKQKFHIPILLGKTVQGDYVMEDLAKMPHAIIAGATGSGKSVCINTIVMSILMSAKPDEIKLIMVDPKKVELTPYTRLPHMLAPVITEPAGACSALKWLVKEMESRYELLKLVGFRNIAGFNERTRNLELEQGLPREVPERLPYIVCIIDELADLMMVASNDIETSIARIAQMARAVGIHLILATQRPSREVITGLIKANFPTRISFKVSSRINSQIILDDVGAEMLLGNGDMLFLPPGSHHLIRAQGVYIRDEDINAVIDKIATQAPPKYLIDSFDEYDSLLASQNSEEEIVRDPLYEQAYEVVLSTKNASTTYLQRKLKVGYARAASIIDQLEATGVVGPADGAKPRKILVKYDGDDEQPES